MRNYFVAHKRPHPPCAHCGGIFEDHGPLHTIHHRYRARPIHKGVKAVKLSKGRSRLVGSRELAQQQGRSKGGQKVWAMGKAHAFTSETARIAQQKAKKALRTHIWDGQAYRPIYHHRRPNVAREPLRQQYAKESWRDVRYDLGLRQWLQRRGDAEVALSERRALQILGYLKIYNKHWVPRPEDVVTWEGQHGKKSV